MKKIISMILALMLIASLSVAGFAAEETGSITINGVGTDGIAAHQASLSITNSRSSLRLSPSSQ